MARSDFYVSAIDMGETSGSVNTTLTDASARPTGKLIRDFIEVASRKQSNISHVYRELIRSLKVEFGSCFYLNSEDKLVGVRCINASPERSVARMVREDNMTLPLIAVGIPTSIGDDKRGRFRPIFRAETYWNHDTQRATRVVSLVPKAIKIEYGVFVWAYAQADMDQLVEQIQGFFKPALELRTKFSESTKAFLKDENDISVVETADREDRMLRKAFTLSIETYIPTPKFMITSTGQIEEFNAELFLKKDSRTSPF